MSGFEVSSAASLEGTRVPEVIAVASVGMVLSTIAVVLRFISRSQTGRVSVDMFWWDDWAILATLIMSHGFLAVNIAWTKYGLGIHFLAIPFSDAVVNNNISHAQILIYAVCIWMIKISTLLLYARIFKFSRKFATTLWAVGGVVTAWFICTAVVPWFNCTPVAKTLNLFEPGECYDRMPWFYASAFINAFFDLLILVLPMPAISRLQMTFRKKILLVIVFVLGYSSAFLSFARFIMIIRDPDLMSTQPSADATWRLIPLLILSMLEAPLAILALCSPLIGQLVARALKHGTFSSMFWSMFSSHRSTGNASSKFGSGYSEVETKDTKPAGVYGSTTAFGQRRESDEDSPDYMAAAAPPIPMGAIGVRRDVEISRAHMERERNMV